MNNHEPSANYPSQTPQELPWERLYDSPETNGYELPFDAGTPLAVGSVALAADRYDLPATVEPEPLFEELAGLERESLAGRQGPDYEPGASHSEAELLARYDDWVRGCGRMLDAAWDEGAITEDVLPEWIALKKEVATAHGIADFYALVDAAVPLRLKTFDFVNKLGVGATAFAGYEAAAN